MAVIDVSDAPQQERYELRVDGEIAGQSVYRLEPGAIEFVHTEIGPRFQGQGLGDQLIGHALEDARRRGLAVLPRCPFVKAFIERHPEYATLVPEDRRAEFGL